MCKTFMKKTILYLLFDLILTLVFSLMFNYHAINASFHEIMGLTFLFACVIHVIIHLSYLIY